MPRYARASSSPQRSARRRPPRPRTSISARNSSAWNAVANTSTSRGVRLSVLRDDSVEVESAVARHPGVGEVAAYAVPSPLGEDEVMLAVVPTDPALSPPELHAYCRDVLPRFSLPSFIRFVPEMPYTPTNKIRKVQLRERRRNASRAPRRLGDARRRAQRDAPRVRAAGRTKTDRPSAAKHGAAIAFDPVALVASAGGAPVASASRSPSFLGHVDASASERVDSAPPARDVEQLEMADRVRERRIDHQLLALRLETEHRPQK